MAKTPSSAQNILQQYDAPPDTSAIDEIKAAVDAEKPSRYIGKLARGNTVLRIAPGRGGPSTPWIYTVWEHSYPIPGGTRVYYVCPRMHGGGACTACTQSEKLLATGSRVDRDQAYAFSAKPKYLVAAMRRGLDAAWKIWKFGKSIFDDLHAFTSPSGMGRNIVHPKAGYDVWVTRSGEGMDTEYKTALDPDGKSPLAETDEEIVELLQSIPDLEQELVPPSAEDIAAMHRGEKPRGRSGHDLPETRPARQMGAPARVPQGRPAKPAAAPAQRADDVVQDFDGGVDEDGIPF